MLQRSKGTFIATLLALTFSNLPVWLNLFHVPLLTPLVWTATVALCGLLSAIWAGAHRVPVPAFVPLTIAIYFCVNVASLAASGGSNSSIVIQRSLMLLTMLLAYWIFVTHPSAADRFRRYLIWVVLLSVVATLYDLTHPFSFVPAESEFATLGRGAGLYANPNVAGAAIIVGALISLTAVPTAWRATYLLAAITGVVATLSRGAMLGALVVTFLVLMAGILRGRDLLALAALAGISGVAAGVWVVPALTEGSVVDPRVAAERLLWILDPSGNADFSQDERWHLLMRGWEQFLERPLLGNGVGSTETWAERTSTHNLFLLLMSDFGILGLSVPLLVVLGALHAARHSHEAASAFAAFFLVWCLVSHNVLTEFYWVLAIAWYLASPRSGLQSESTATKVASR